jgi:hypothetical protein
VHLQPLGHLSRYKKQDLRALPSFKDGQCLQNVSTRDFCAVLAADSTTSTSYHRKFSGAKPKHRIDERCTIENRAAVSNYAEERKFL